MQFPHPQATAGLASLADIFPVDPFFAFFPHCGAWSQAIILKKNKIHHASTWLSNFLGELIQ